tara:strand:+ start:102 stop:599 length:498 start_codon:yes stop_codon:yes gene_type:complete
MSLDFLNPSNEPDLVYRKAPHMDSLVFSSPEDAMVLDQIHEAIRAETWKEFEYLMPPGELAELLCRRNEYFEEDEEGYFKIPAPFERFKFEQLCPAVNDGDYPVWYQKQQEYWLPHDVLERWGRLENTMFNGEFWIIDPDNEKDILKDLMHRRLKVEEREDLYFY